MQRVTGIGGVFFRAKDPGALAQWYLEHLGINLVPQDAEGAPWVTEAGVTVFSPFAADTDYFRAESQFMINFRVADLAAMCAQLEAAGIETFNHSEMERIGKFAHLHDPEGNPLELWEPAG
ncbi:Glyoxalase family protein [Candidatus Rhodobacter oscarellae]|uniref:Glyoxalase family protein n=1 Tax=Candidatus Rhodobacter oscarellae TaxID=1675527 RepID=A0A0J9E8R4_9RHOB|nr:VOC family protein [Candidatus Rhodobacter lobularis]KMW59051.1 Glyoxalase family protein [Candidatus Rhodobacter lobularis]